MIYLSHLSILSTLVLLWNENVSSYSILPQSVARGQLKELSSRTLLLAKSHPEFSVVDEEKDSVEVDDAISAAEGEDYILTKNDPQPSEQAPTRGTEYGALAPGTVVQVQVGDLALARKAWKKRRRTGSPLLVPCSILNVDKQSMVRWNLIYLLEKFGRSQRDGIEITSSELSKRYRQFLKSSLQRQSSELGHDSINEMILALFNKKTQESYGVRLIEREENDLSLKIPISRHKAHKRAAAAAVLQFRPHREGDHGDMDTLTHTGYVRSRDDQSEDRSYHFLPLSAALRVSQKDDVDTGRVENGSIHPAVVFDYDLAGDGGSPLLTLSLNPRGVRDTLKVKPDRRYAPLDNPQVMFHDLAVGDGPFTAKVIRLLSGKALIDFDVGRKTSSGGVVKILGALRYKDSVDIVSEITDPNMIDESFFFQDDETEDVIEGVLDDLDFDDEDEDELEEDDNDSLVEDLLSLRSSSSFEEGTFEEGEEEEDISSLFSMNADGSLTYTDPDTGETDTLDVSDDGYEDMLAVKTEFERHLPPMKKAKGFQKENSEDKKTKSAQKSISENQKLVSKRLRVGDEVQVYIRTVSKQSSQFTVTTNASVQGMKAKEIKKEGDAEKKLKRLKKSLGGSLNRIWELEGEECDGTVKATSKTGDWVYVQPELDGLPVGIATLTDGSNDLNPGDSVRVRISGVDEERGQLALEVV